MILSIAAIVLLFVAFLSALFYLRLKTSALKSISQERDQLRLSLDGLEQEYRLTRDQKIYLEAQIKMQAEKEAIWQQAEKNLKDAFQSLSSKALQENNQSFMDLAKLSFEKLQNDAKHDLTARSKAIETLLQPVQETLKQVDEKIQHIELARAGAYQGLHQQVQHLLDAQKDLKAETTNLVHALKTPHVRGRWGEMQLRRVVEMAGMMAHTDFQEQVGGLSSEGDRLRPDMIVHLPGGKQIIVDAKAPLLGYLQSIEATDEVQRAHYMKQHARHIRTHIQALSARSYWDGFQNTPEFVVLFLPGETFFSAALQEDPSLIEMGAENKVILATPTTLIALLRAVSYGWRQEKLAENAREISDLGKELHRRVGDMAKHFAKVGKHLSGAVESYNQTLGTLERRVLVSARKFEALNVAKMDDTLPKSESIDSLPRPLLTGDDADERP